MCSPWSFYYGNCQHQTHTACLFFPYALWAHWNHLNHEKFSLRNKQRPRWALVSFHKHNLSPGLNKTLRWSVHCITPTSRLKDINKGATGNEKNKTTVATKVSKSRKPKWNCIYQNKCMLYLITPPVMSTRAPYGQVPKQWAFGRAGGLKPETG